MTTRDGPAEKGGHLRFRPDIEGLRAVAIIFVVLYHAGLRRAGGGFLGVDVFFVLSGFLITGIIVDEIAATGTLSLVNFWARRARRLLPAATFITLVVLVANAVLLSPRSLIVATVVLSLVSLAGCVLLVRRYPVGAFYILPPRAWEFGLGALAVLLMRIGNSEPGIPQSPIPSPKALIPVVVELVALGSMLGCCSPQSISAKDASRHSDWPR